MSKLAGYTHCLTIKKVNKLPFTVFDPRVTEDMIVDPRINYQYMIGQSLIKKELLGYVPERNVIFSNPDAIKSELRVSTFNGYVTIDGIIEGETDVTLYLINQSEIEQICKEDNL